MLDSIFSFFDRVIQSVVIQSLLNNFEWVDWFAVLFLVLGIIYGIQNGLVAEIAEIFEIVVVVFLTLENYQKIQPLVQKWLPFVEPASEKSVTYLLTGFLIWIVIGVTLRLFKKHMHTDLAKPLRIGGGAFLGAIHFMVIFSFLSQAVILMPIRQINGSYNPGQSYSGHFIARLAPTIHDVIRQPMDLLGTNDQKSDS